MDGGADTAASSLPSEVALAYARAGLANIQREYPNHPGHLLTGPDDLRPPSALHPIFYGSFDWHSAVHQHWMLVRLLRLFPDLEVAAQVRTVLTARFTTEAAEAEAAYLSEPLRRSFERPYGWAWLLTLAAELDVWEDPASEVWQAGLHPLVREIRTRCLTWLTETNYPQRSGTHGNSAFAAVLLHDAAAATTDRELARAVGDAAHRWYADDAGYAAWIEPSATDFLSPALTEVDLLRRVLDPAAFTGWVGRFLPDPSPLTRPAVVADRTDPQGVHLDGLNLSRAWCWRGLAEALPADEPLREVAREAAARHAAASLPAVLTGEYVGEHWLPTFAVYLLCGGTAAPPPATDVSV